MGGSHGEKNVGAVKKLLLSSSIELSFDCVFLHNPCYQSKRNTTRQVVSVLLEALNLW